MTDIAQGSMFAEEQMTSYAEVATSPLLNTVISDLGLPMSADDLSEWIIATVTTDTAILDMSVTTNRPRSTTWRCSTALRCFWSPHATILSKIAGGALIVVVPTARTELS